jgi:hypothetical protein
MFKQIVALDRVIHRSLRFNPKQTHSFAAQMMVTPIVAGEANLIAREYPLLFARQPDSLPLALLGVAQGNNAYVQANGRWQARYIPAHIRRYPFMLADSAATADADGARNFTMMIDSAAPHFQGDQGSSLLDAAGEPTAILQQAQQVLISLQRDEVRTRKLVSEIESAGLLRERVLKAKPKKGKPFALEGLRIIDKEKFSALPAETLASLHHSGALALIYAHLLSLNNLQDGVLSQADRIAAAAPVPAVNADTLSFAGFNSGKNS